MLYLKSFCFNPFQENTYLVYDDAANAMIIDPGNSTPSEDAQLKTFLDEKKLNLRRLLLTHGHIDHVLGNHFIFKQYGLLPEVHEEDLFFIKKMQETGSLYGVQCEQSPLPEHFLKEGENITLGKYVFESIYTPGHSPGSLSFYNRENKLLISGDALFSGSIGRSDLPGGDHETLIRSIREKLLVLDDDTKVYCGHGPATTIGVEKRSNPFLT
jgi:hydroxyacylglutathione hydrolase